MASPAIPVYLNLTASRPSRVARRNAAVLALLFFLGAVLVGFVADQPRAVFRSFIPMVGVAIVMLDALTAYVLTIQFYNSRQLSVAILACAYGFVVPIAVLQMAIFPSSIWEGEAFLGASEASAWLWVFWHTGFPLIVLLSMIAEWRTGGRLLSPAQYRATWHMTILLPLLLAVAAGAFAVGAPHWLAPIIAGNNYSQIGSGVLGAVVLGANLVAAVSVLVIGRARNVLMLWLSLATFANLLSVFLTLLGGARYSTGWYGARYMSVVTSMIVLAVTLWEVTKLYARLTVANRRLSDLASHDGLTGLHNRRYFDSAVEAALTQAHLNQTPVSLLMLDIDFFKLYNDAFGHGKGDEILIEVAQLLQQTARSESDTVARYGGEEFVLLLPGASVKQAARIAERVRNDLAQLKIRAPQTPLSLPYLTVSMGIVQWLPGLDLSPQALVAAADRALYESKNSGRNATTISRDLRAFVHPARAGERLPKAAQG